MERRWFYVLAGAVPGGLLGLWAGWSASRGTFNVSSAYFGAGIVALLVVVLVIVAAIAKWSGPLIAALALVATYLVGYVVAPGASGSTQRAPGTGTAGTRADPIAIWSGSVSCEWPKDEATSVEKIRGFHVAITDPNFEAIRLPDGNAEMDVYLHPYFEVGYSESLHVGPRIVVDVEGLTTDGRTGTAFLPQAAGIVLQWRCSGGP